MHLKARRIPFIFLLPFLGNLMRPLTHAMFLLYAVILIRRDRKLNCYSIKLIMKLRWLSKFCCLKVDLFYRAPYLNLHGNSRFD